MTFEDFELTQDMIKEQDIKETLNTLNIVNYQIAELARIKEELEARVCALVEHGDDGQKTYTVGKFKATVSTGYIYALNKSEYEVVSAQIQGCFNPVKTKTVYEIDKTIIRDLDTYGSEDDKKLIDSFITRKRKKLHIRLSAGV